MRNALRKQGEAGPLRQLISPHLNVSGIQGDGILFEAVDEGGGICVWLTIDEAYRLGRVFVAMAESDRQWRLGRYPHAQL